MTALAIDLDRPPPVPYRPGDSVRGSVRLSGVDATVLALHDRIRISVVGEEMAVSYDPETVGEYRRASVAPICLGEAIAALPPPPSSSSGGGSAAAAAAVPFLATIPPGAPGSIGVTSSRLHPESWCEVRYYVRAVLLRSDESAAQDGAAACGGTFGSGDDLRSERAFLVRGGDGSGKYGDDGAGAASLPPEAEYVPLCGAAPASSLPPPLGRGSVTWGLGVDRTLVVPGDVINVTVDVSDESTAAVRAVNARIVERVSWRAGGRTEGRTEILTEATAPTESGGGSSSASLCLAVPPAARPTYDGGRRISVRHQVCVSLEVASGGPSCGGGLARAVPVRVAPGREATGIDDPEAGGRDDVVVGGERPGAVVAVRLVTEEEGGVGASSPKRSGGPKKRDNAVLSVLTSCYTGRYGT